NSLIGSNRVSAKISSQKTFLASDVQMDSILSHQEKRDFKGEKVSSDIKGLIGKLQTQTVDRDQNYVNAIIQVDDTGSKKVRRLLKRTGALVKGEMHSLGSLAVEVPAESLQSLVDSDEVSYISSNREVAAMGHLSLTTGTDAVRNQVNPAGKSYLLEGTGIGIAILDSGIDSTHKAFKDDKGNSRVKVSLDFTGEGLTTD